MKRKTEDPGDGDHLKDCPKKKVKIDTSLKADLLAFVSQLPSLLPPPDKTSWPERCTCYKLQGYLCPLHLCNYYKEKYAKVLSWSEDSMHLTNIPGMTLAWDANCSIDGSKVTMRDWGFRTGMKTEGQLKVMPELPFLDAEYQKGYWAGVKCHSSLRDMPIRTQVYIWI